MLARGVLCRLAADVPKRSTHDLPQLARLLQRAVVSRNVASIAPAAALSHAYRLTLSQSRRSYATARATKTRKTSKAKTTKKKPAAKKKTATKKKAKAKPKKKTTATRRAKKPLTEDQKLKLKIKELKTKALRQPSGHATSAWTVFAAEKTKGASGSAQDNLRQAAAAFKELSPAEREHYNHIANENKAKEQREHKAWVQKYTPEEIRQANLARKYLRRLAAAAKPSNSKRKYPPNTGKIVDDRQLVKPTSAFIKFYAERQASGDLKAIPLTEATTLVGREWKVLSAGEKKKYEDAYAAERVKYAREYKSLYGHAPSGAKA